MASIILISLSLFIIAALFEIGGAYLVYKWIRNKKSLIMGLFGGVILFLYGVIQTFQEANFGKVYAAYGGIFVISTLIWGAVIDKKTPDRYEIIGALFVLIGVLVIFFMPR